jgi:hypothetical protein
MDRYTNDDDSEKVINIDCTNKKIGHNGQEIQMEPGAQRLFCS